MTENYEADYDQQHDKDVSVLSADANRRLRALDHWLQELDEARQAYLTERRRIGAWLKIEENRIQKRIDWCELTLRQFLESTGKKSLSLPYGKLQRRAGRVRIDVVLEDTFVDWAEKSGNKSLLRTTVKPDKGAILEFVKNTGEEPPGVELNVGQESFSAKPDAAA